MVEVVVKFGLADSPAGLPAGAAPFVVGYLSIAVSFLVLVVVVVVVGVVAFAAAVVAVLGLVVAGATVAFGIIGTEELQNTLAAPDLVGLVAGLVDLGLVDGKAFASPIEKEEVLVPAIGDPQSSKAALADLAKEVVESPRAELGILRFSRAGIVGPGILRAAIAVPGAALGVELVDPGASKAGIVDPGTSRAAIDLAVSGAGIEVGGSGADLAGLGAWRAE